MSHQTYRASAPPMAARTTRAPEATIVVLPVFRFQLLDQAGVEISRGICGSRASLDWRLGSQVDRRVVAAIVELPEGATLRLRRDAEGHWQ